MHFCQDFGDKIFPKKWRISLKKAETGRFAEKSKKNDIIKTYKPFIANQQLSRYTFIFIG
jgi:hypothetical protein